MPEKNEATEAENLTPNELSELLSLAQTLVRLPSENPPGDERVVADYIETRLAAEGLAVERVPVSSVPASRECLLFQLPGQMETPFFLFSGHMDVVPVAAAEAVRWSKAPYAGQIEDGKLWGRGSCDMKSGLAAALYALILLKRRPAIPPRPILFALTVDEEDRMSGSKALLNHPLIKMAKEVMICEPTELKICTAGCGRSWAEIEVQGHTAHGSDGISPQNAILLANKLISRLMAVDFETCSRSEFGNSFWQPLRIEAGVDPSVIPDRCRFTLDARLVPGHSPETVWERAQLEIDRLRGEAAGFQAELKIIESRYPWTAAETSPFVAAARAAGAEAGLPAETALFPGSTDGNIFMTAGIAPLICGPGSLAQAHRENEYVAVEQIGRACAFYHRLMLNPPVNGWGR